MAVSSLIDPSGLDVPPRATSVLIVSATEPLRRHETIPSADERNDGTACQTKPVGRAIPAAAREPAGCKASPVARLPCVAGSL
ncbi:MAG: hypothetical protein H7062_19035 [Candidatus Saccharimonas sp.]|nr:hypothetical protein [Planctomycetaceae bacterium]